MIQIGLFGLLGQIESLLRKLRQFGLPEKEVIKIMRSNLKPTSFKLWRKRVHEKSIKHRKLFENSRKKIKKFDLDLEL